MNSNKNSMDKILWFLAIVGTLVGLVGLYDRIVHGHLNADYGSYVPWGLWVAGYIYLIGLSAGAFLMSTLVYVFRIEALEKIGKIALLTALATLIGALLTIWMDLGHMGRAWRLIFRTNFGSVMGWMAWLYSLYFILLLIEFWFAMRSSMAENINAPGIKGSVCRLLVFGKTDTSIVGKDKDARTLRILGSLGIPLAVAFHGSVGAIFGVVGARPYWNSGLTPIIFLVGALLSGGALLAFLVSQYGPAKGSESHKKIVSIIGMIIVSLLAFDVLLEWAEISVGMWQSVPSESASMRMVLFGHFWWVFWVIHLGFGVIVPAFLLVFKRNSVKAVGFAGLLIAFTFITVRLNIVIPALAVPELEGLKHAFTGPGLHFEYVPTFMEWAVFVFTVSMAGLVFLIGKSVLPVLDVDSKGKEA